MAFTFNHKPINKAIPFPSAEVLKDIAGAVRDASANGTRFIQKYPAQRLLKTGYRRTGTLKRSWSFKVVNGATQITGTVGSNSNMAPYNRPVQGSPQVRLFKGAGWRNIDVLQRKMENEFNKDLETILKRAVN